MPNAAKLPTEEHPTDKAVECIDLSAIDDVPSLHPEDDNEKHIQEHVSKHSSDMLSSQICHPAGGAVECIDLTDDLLIGGDPGDVPNLQTGKGRKEKAWSILRMKKRAKSTLHFDKHSTDVVFFDLSEETSAAPISCHPWIKTERGADIENVDPVSLSDGVCTTRSTTLSITRGADKTRICEEVDSSGFRSKIQSSKDTKLVAKEVSSSSSNTSGKNCGFANSSTMEVEEAVSSPKGSTKGIGCVGRLNKNVKRAPASASASSPSSASATFCEKGGDEHCVDATAGVQSSRVSITSKDQNSCVSDQVTHAEPSRMLRATAGPIKESADYHIAHFGTKELPPFSSSSSSSSLSPSSSSSSSESSNKSVVGDRPLTKEPSTGNGGLDTVSTTSANPQRRNSRSLPLPSVYLSRNGGECKEIHSCLVHSMDSTANNAREDAKEKSLLCSCSSSLSDRKNISSDVEGCSVRPPGISNTLTLPIDSPPREGLSDCGCQSGKRGDDNVDLDELKKVQTNHPRNESTLNPKATSTMSKTDRNSNINKNSNSNMNSNSGSGLCDQRNNSAKFPQVIDFPAREHLLHHEYPTSKALEGAAFRPSDDLPGSSPPPLPAADAAEQRCQSEGRDSCETQNRCSSFRNSSLDGEDHSSSMPSQKMNGRGKNKCNGGGGDIKDKDDASSEPCGNAQSLPLGIGPTAQFGLSSEEHQTSKAHKDGTGGDEYDTSTAHASDDFRKLDSPFTPLAKTLGNGCQHQEKRKHSNTAHTRVSSLKDANSDNISGVGFVAQSNSSERLSLSSHVGPSDCDCPTAEEGQNGDAENACDRHPTSWGKERSPSIPAVDVARNLDRLQPIPAFAVQRMISPFRNPRSDGEAQVHSDEKPLQLKASFENAKCGESVGSIETFQTSHVSSSGCDDQMSKASDGDAFDVINTGAATKPLNNLQRPISTHLQSGCHGIGMNTQDNYSPDFRSKISYLQSNKLRKNDNSSSSPESGATCGSPGSSKSDMDEALLLSTAVAGNGSTRSVSSSVDQKSMASKRSKGETCNVEDTSVSLNDIQRSPGLPSAALPVEIRWDSVQSPFGFDEDDDFTEGNTMFCSGSNDESSSMSSSSSAGFSSTTEEGSNKEYFSWHPTRQRYFRSRLQSLVSWEKHVSS